MNVKDATKKFDEVIKFPNPEHFKEGNVKVIIMMGDSLHTLYSNNMKDSDINFSEYKDMPKSIDCILVYTLKRYFVKEGDILKEKEI